MLLLQSVEDVKERLRLVRRTTDAHPNVNQSHTLQTVVDHISRVAENCP
jgi:hypothetical protein